MRVVVSAAIPTNDGGEVLREILSITTEVTAYLKAKSTFNAASGQPTSFSGLEPPRFYSNCRITTRP
jgi:hypothetical protein